MSIILRPYQSAAIEAARAELRRGVKRLIISAPTGAGKCLAPGTSVIMADGGGRWVEHVRDGEALMGPDGRPRSVTGVVSGRGPMVEILPVRGWPWKCTADHILTLSDGMFLVDMPVSEWRARDREFRRKHELVRIHRGAGTAETVGFTVRDAGIGPWHGFSLDGDGRFLLGDGTITHNTEIAMSLISAAVDKGSRVSFIADRRSLVQQTSRRFSDAGIRHGILMGNDTVGTHESVRVESAQTIQKRGLRESDLFVADEIHECRPEMIRLIARSGAVLIGLTATPFPAALAEPIDAHLPKAERQPAAPPRYEAMVSTVTTDQLIADGHLCPFDVVAPVATVDTEGVKVQGGEFHKPSLKDRIMRIVGDIVPTWRAQLDERYGGEVQPTIVFGATVDDAEAIQREFRDAGYPARLVSSREDEDENKRIINEFREGEFDVLVNCAMLSRGMDFPRAAILLDAYPMRKILTPIQRYGRIMRTFPGKDRSCVVDFAENWLHMRDRILEFYTGGPEWPPPEHANKAARKKSPDRDSICQQCRTIIPPGDSVCPGCGAAKPVRTYGGVGSRLEKVNGSLRLIDSVTGAASAYGGDLWPEVSTAAILAAKGDSERAYKRALASYRSITGQWPPARKLRPLDRPPDPAVVDLMDRSFKAWIISRRASQGARA